MKHLNELNVTALAYGPQRKCFELVFISRDYYINYDIRLYRIFVADTIRIEWDGIQYEMDYDHSITVKDLIGKMGFCNWSAWGEICDDFLDMPVTDVPDDRIWIQAPYGTKWAKKEWFSNTLINIQCLDLAHAIERDYSPEQYDDMDIYEYWILPLQAKKQMETTEQITEIMDGLEKDLWLDHTVSSVLINALEKYMY